MLAWQPDAITKLSALVASEPLQTWKDYLRFHAINHGAGLLPKAYADAAFDFYGRELSGTTKQTDRWKRGIGSTSNALGDAVGKIYVKQYFPASSKAQVEDMVKNIVAAFDDRLTKLEWMAPATKEKARTKVKEMQVAVGYPETWRDYSRRLKSSRDDALGNYLRAEKFEYQHQLSKLGKPLDRREWWMTPQTVNAVNLPLQNALNFPAAILEAPFFDPKADPAANYGAIGAVIGHEISHSFDNTRRRVRRRRHAAQLVDQGRHGPLQEGVRRARRAVRRVRAAAGRAPQRQPGAGRKHRRRRRPERRARGVSQVAERQGSAGDRWPDAATSASSSPSRRHGARRRAMPRCATRSSAMATRRRVIAR